MIRIRRAAERGHANHGWLNTYHTFSFATYQDPAHKRFRSLRVINEDWIAPGQGFGTHPHENMEIVTYVLSGALEHRDSMGNGEVLRPGEFQRMSAGSGITHSEFNPSPDEPTHLYQIWLYPAEKGIEPSYEQKRFPADGHDNEFRLVASPDAAHGSLTIHQDVCIFLAELNAGKTAHYEISPGRYAWLQVLRGAVQCRDLLLAPGDGVAISEETAIDVTGKEAAEVMLFDLA